VEEGKNGDVWENFDGLFGIGVKGSDQWDGREGVSEVYIRIRVIEGEKREKVSGGHLKRGRF
jgi:hypothetical protein